MGCSCNTLIVRVLHVSAEWIIGCAKGILVNGLNDFHPSIIIPGMSYFCFSLFWCWFLSFVDFYIILKQMGFLLK